MSRLIDLKGRQFGLWVVLEKVERGDSKSDAAHWLCECVCGNRRTITSGNLRRGRSQSCKSCIARKQWFKHGHSIHNLSESKSGKSRTYTSWLAMKSRCSNKNHKYYKNYGGRGITVCARWLTFENFISDMGERPKGTSIDRINPDGNYKPDNCRWASASQQNLNKRRRKK